MRSLVSLVTSIICSIILLIFNTYTFYDKYTSGSTYFWINGILTLAFLSFLIIDLRNLLNKNYKTSESN
ncbi:hypothetical protein [Bacillus arachidis]|uniref:hypothetical protein n=1 Tax=Bacillus arachidis TaxID=2819290 RepID=UPI00255C2C51|nr:hypothetical protein [Bacillus arachidis]WIY58951.1 hypothetical protein QRY57_00585 [Bacillus arachidis]